MYSPLWFLIPPNLFKGCYILDQCIYLLWHRPTVFSAIKEVCPTGYICFQEAHSTGQGGDLSVIHHIDLDLFILPLSELSSFECLCLKSKLPVPMTFLSSTSHHSLTFYFLSLLYIFCPISANISILRHEHSH